MCTGLLYEAEYRQDGGYWADTEQVIVGRCTGHLRGLSTGRKWKVLVSDGQVRQICVRVGGVSIERCLNRYLPQFPFGSQLCSSS